MIWVTILRVYIRLARGDRVYVVPVAQEENRSRRAISRSLQALSSAGVSVVSCVDQEDRRLIYYKLLDFITEHDEVIDEQAK